MRSKYPPTGTRGRNWWSRQLVNVVFSSGASDGDSLEVSAVMRQVLSVTRRLLVLMLLDLFFTGVPNLRPPAKAVILRVDGERALLLRTNFSRSTFPPTCSARTPRGVQVQEACLKLPLTSGSHVDCCLVGNLW